MPVRSVIDKERRLVLTFGEGSVTYSEVRNHQDRLLSDPDFDATFNQLIDVTQAQFDMSTDDARAVASRPIFSTTSRRAFVASKPSVYGLGRLMEVHQERHAQVQIFYDRKEALKWLGINDDPGLL